MGQEGVVVSGGYTPEGPAGAASGIANDSSAPGVTVADALARLFARDAHVHTQAAPAKRWTVTHNLGRMPAITVIDVDGHEVIGDLAYDSVNQVTLLFSMAVSGVAYCS